MLKVIEKALLLQEVDALKFVSADHLMQLAEVSREETFKKGEIIAQRGDSPLTIYLLLGGKATLDEDNSLVLEKSALNLCSGLAGVRYPYNCICLEDCTVLAIATGDLMDLMAGEPEFSLAFLKYFASKLLDGSGRCL
jgi:CRP-like cAMP-binding protein